MLYSDDNLTLLDLPNGTHTITFSLVDTNHNPLDPPVEVTLEFTTTVALGDDVNCGDSGTYTTVNGTSGTSSFPDTFTGPDESHIAFVVAAEEEQEVTLVIGGETEENWDWIYITNGSGEVIYGPATGPQDVTVQSIGTTTVYVAADSSVTRDLTFDI